MDQEQDSLLDNGSISSFSNRLNIEPILTENDRPDPSGIQIPPAVFPEIFAGFSAALSALSAGIVLGWTSPIFDYLIDGKYNNIPIDHNQMGWIGSLATLGAMAMCIPTGFICDLIGRKRALLCLIVPFLIGWSLIIWATHILELYLGRFIAGMAVGACCVAAPLYNGEIAHKSVRGKLGFLFQLLICLGIFMAYLFGWFLTPLTFTWVSASMPLVFFLFFVFQPESPTYLLKKNQREKAKQALIRLRGPNYNADEELLEIEDHLKEATQTTISLRSTFSKKSVQMAVLISLALMLFQQLCGINAIILYSSSIFSSVGVNFDAHIATIMVGAFQVVSTFCASLVIDKVGRKFLLSVSLALVTISNIVLAIFMTVKPYLDNGALIQISFLPVSALCLFVIAFSFGLGPIPWMIASDIVPHEIRSMVGSNVGTFNWLLAFMVTKVFLLIAGHPTAFYVFGVFSILGTLFVMILVPETKGKTILEIQEELENIL